MVCRPKFFLIGAPKCGTTALSEYLRQHPRICFSRPKEPYHFCTDLPGYSPGWTDEEYLRRCFGHCEAASLSAGEGTVFYLYSREAVPRIIEFEPESRFIVMLRNPVDLAHAFHSQLLYPDFSEDVADFRDAWNLQDRRRRGESIPQACRDPRVLQYRDVAAIGSQLSRLLDQVQRERVKIIFFSDFTTHTGDVYRDVLDFLGVPDDHRSSFPRINAAEEHRWRALAQMTQQPPRSLVQCVAWLKRTLPVERFGVLSRLRSWNSRRKRRPPLDPEFRRELILEFEDEIGLVERICGRRLDHWRDENRVGLGNASPTVGTARNR